MIYTADIDNGYRRKGQRRVKAATPKQERRTGKKNRRTWDPAQAE
jgi:hypothetical protein